MSLFDEIQAEILSTASLSTVLRKAKVLAYRLKNQEFKDWIEHELNGYDNVDFLPKYRRISTHSKGDFLNPGWKMKGVPIPPNNIPREIREVINEVNMKQGIKELEGLLDTLKGSGSDTLGVPWPPNLLHSLSERVFADTACLGAWRVITKGQITAIIENTRNRLLTFILELGERYPEAAKEGFDTAGRKLPDNQIRQVFNYIIMGDAHSIVGSANSVSQGGNMAIFDQRNQNVNYQYNAAGDINFDGVQNRVELIGELEKLKAELSRASSSGAIDGEIVTDAEYQITKAIQQSQKSQPDKTTILEHLRRAKSFVESVTVATGMVTALVKAGELVQHLF
jgi:hypothetical protein